MAVAASWQHCHNCSQVARHLPIHEPCAVKEGQRLSNRWRWISLVLFRALASRRDAQEFGVSQVEAGLLPKTQAQSCDERLQIVVNGGDFDAIGGLDLEHEFGDAATLALLGKGVWLVMICGGAGDVWHLPREGDSPLAKCRNNHKAAKHATTGLITGQGGGRAHLVNLRGR